MSVQEHPHVPPSTGKLQTIQYLRAVAALMVAYLHMLEQVPADYVQLLFPAFLRSDRLSSGVDIFFTISGFIMVMSSLRSTPAEFAMRRIFRIVPLYWILTIAMATAIFLHPALFPHTRVDVPSLVKSLLFIPYQNPNFDGGRVPILFPGWTLNFEMYFYAIFALVLFFPVSWRVSVNALVFSLLIAVRCLLSPEGAAEFYTRPQILEFLVGMLIAVAYMKGRIHVSGIRAGILLLCGFGVLLVNWTVPASLHPLQQDSVPVSLVAAGIVVVGMLSLKPLAGRLGSLLELLGNASYSIYLSHIFFLGAVRAAWRPLLHGSVGVTVPLVFAAISMAMVVLGGILIYKRLELPLLTVMQTWYRSRSALPSAGRQMST